MEEKLYFTPANYGKSRNKKGKKDEPKKSKDHKIIRLALLLLFLLAIIILIIWLLRGKTTVSGQYPENVKNYSMTCVSSETVPEKLATASSEDKELKINAIFNGETKLKSISLVYTAIYPSEEAAYGVEAHTHAEFNHALSASGYGVEKFSNKFSRYGEKLIISLYAQQSEIDEISAPYFLIPLDDNHKVSLETLTDYKESYEKRGFVCSAN